MKELKFHKCQRIPDTIRLITGGQNSSSKKWEKSVTSLSGVETFPFLRLQYFAKSNGSSLFKINLMLFVGWEWGSCLFPSASSLVLPSLHVGDYTKLQPVQEASLQRSVKEDFLLIFYELTDSLLVICWLFVLRFYMERTQAPSASMCGFTEKMPATMCLMQKEQLNVWKIIDH